MEWYWALTLLTGTLLGLMAIGLPVAYAFFSANIIGAILFMRGDPGMMQFLRSAVDANQSTALLPIPLFILMGEVMFQTGVAQRAIAAIDRLIARVPGRLSILAILGGTAFSSLSGSTIANTAMLGSTLLPDMLKRGYNPRIAIGPIVAVGGLAMLVPPSALAVLLGSVARIPIADLLVAAVLPAILLAVLYLGYVILRCYLNPELAPGYDLPETKGFARYWPFLRDVVPLAGIFAVVAGSIISGIATPTESAALGVVATLIAALAYGQVSLSTLRKAVSETLKFTTMTLFIIAGSVTFSQLLAFSGVTRGVTDLVLQSGFGPYSILIALLVVTVILGCFVDQVSMILLTVPLYFPIITGLGFDAVWFAVLLLLVLEMSLATPPFGMLLFVMSGVAPKEISMGEIIRAVLPFLGLTVFVILVLLLFPDLALWLPSQIPK